MTSFLGVLTHDKWRLTKTNKKQTKNKQTNKQTNKKQQQTNKQTTESVNYLTRHFCCFYIYFFNNVFIINKGQYTPPPSPPQHLHFFFFLFCQMSSSFKIFLGFVTIIKQFLHAYCVNPCNLNYFSFN